MNAIEFLLLIVNLSFKYRSKRAQNYVHFPTNTLYKGINFFISPRAIR